MERKPVCGMRGRPIAINVKPGRKKECWIILEQSGKRFDPRLLEAFLVLLA